MAGRCRSAAKADWPVRWRRGVSRMFHRWGSPTDVDSQSTLVVGSLRVTSSRNPLASRQPNSPNFPHQLSSVILPSARQMSWQKVRQVQWKPAGFPAHLPQNRPLPHGISVLPEMLQWKYVHLELLQPVLQMNPDWRLQAEMGTRCLSPFCSSTCAPFPGAEGVQSSTDVQLNVQAVKNAEAKKNTHFDHSPPFVDRSLLERERWH